MSYNSTMEYNPFQNPQTAQKYLAYLESKDGTIQRQVLLEYLEKRLVYNQSQTILDAGCGNGWLVNALAPKLSSIVGCDASTELLKDARQHIPSGSFTQASLSEPLPYPEGHFDAIILNMVAQDVSDLNALFSHTTKVLRKHGTMLVTIPNPFYAYPKGVWKRGWLGRIFGLKPKLTLVHKQRAKAPGRPVATYHRELSIYLNGAFAHGLILTHMEEIKSLADSPTFDLRYQLFRFPIILLLELKKIA